MKVLWVKAGGLVPQDVGGRIRSYKILRELARRHAVTVFTFYAAEANDEHLLLQGVFDQLICLPLHLPPPRGLREALDFARLMVSSRPYTVSKYCRPEVADALSKVLARQSYDVIVCDFAIAGGVIPWDYPCPKVLFTHNVEALIWRRHASVARNPLWKAVSWWEYHKMTRFERTCLNKSQRVLTVSETDRAFFSHIIDPAKITVIPTGVDTDYFRPTQETEEPDSLVFTGSMDWMPNEDGILYFVREILPVLRQQLPRARLTVVGRSPSERVRSLARADQSIRITGRVDDIRPYVNQASVYVVPLRVGSGTRLKIFEAMAMGKAIVSTTLGAEGLPVTHGENILLADSPNDFAKVIVTLMNSPAMRTRLGLAARQLVERNYSWGSVASQFDAALQQVKAGTRRIEGNV